MLNVGGRLRELVVRAVLDDQVQTVRSVVLDAELDQLLVLEQHLIDDLRHATQLLRNFHLHPVFGCDR